MHALAGHAEFVSHVRRFATQDQHSINEQLSTVNRQPGISVRDEDLRGVSRDVRHLH